MGQGRPFGYDFPAKEVAKAAGEVTLACPSPVGRREERSCACCAFPREDRDQPVLLLLRLRGWTAPKSPSQHGASAQG